MEKKIIKCAICKQLKPSYGGSDMCKECLTRAYSKQKPLDHKGYKSEVESYNWFHKRNPKVRSCPQ